ncbi:alkaline phosphatase family protein [Priestia megaterium]|uniref:alkaline phosphatase family protein n=1 Tax=Priestia megaterium TaxID=1404 RepID=UPI002A6A2C12|nr:alkaline phosphatase family protein [Priestia megaterium]MDY0943919.1 alkaline phosphatase family protein [Priestia megaterium]
MVPEVSHEKRIIMLIVDTLMDSSLQAALKHGKAPAFKFLIEKGHYFSNVISPFPTMSVNVDSTLLTGVNSDKHKIPGLVWYSQKEKRIINYGSHVRELFKLGLKQSMEDIFFNFNHEHLSKKQQTIHEFLKDKGIQTASINTLLYRGSNVTQIKVPFLLSLLTGINKELVAYSPDLFTYGTFRRLNPLKKNTYFWQRYGFNDQFTVNELRYLIDQNRLPPLTIAYFPNLDQSVHKNGRRDIKGIEQVDKELQKILNQYSSWDEALLKNIWVITGDNGQAWVGKNRKEALIDLRDLLKSYRIVKLRKGVTHQDQIVLCVNERMAFIYSLDGQRFQLNEIAGILKKDKRIDIIALKDKKIVTVTSGIHTGQLTFHPQGEYIDNYGQSWYLEGNEKILDISIDNKKIDYGDYPDALTRLYSSFFSHDGEYIVVSAKPGYEFIGEGSPKHVGGASHGGLHKEDSLVSMIIIGTDSVPKYLRIVDIKEWLLTLVQS